MTIAAMKQSKSVFTPEDLLLLEGGEELYELVDGQLLEKPMSSLAARTAVRLSTRLELFCDENGIAQVFSEQTHQCFPSNPDQVRRPDLSVILTSRLPLGEFPEGHLRIPPDIAIEILSPNDRVRDLDEKLDDYRSAGVSLVWIVKPERRSVVVYRADGSQQPLMEQDTLIGEPVLPGFSVVVASLFPAKKANTVKSDK